MSNIEASTDSDSVYEEPVRDQASDAESDPDADPDMLTSGESGQHDDQAEGDDDPAETGTAS
ncbi:MAG: hypothetical protein PGN29_13185 [Gordonia paraffinivorans]